MCTLMSVGKAFLLKQETPKPKSSEGRGRSAATVRERRFYAKTV